MKPTPIGRFADTPSYEELQREVARLRLTDEERAALQWFAHYGLPEHRAAALRGLLERLA